MVVFKEIPKLPSPVARKAKDAKKMWKRLGNGLELMAIAHDS